MNTDTLRGAVLATALAILSGPSLAHVTLEPGEVPAGARVRAVLQVNHGCGGRATTAISVAVPGALAGLRPMPKPGWNLAVTPASDPAGNTTVTWSGGSLPDAFYDEFVLIARLPKDAEPARVVALPVRQSCGDTIVAWSDGPSSARPAPTIQVAAARPDAADVTAGSLTIAAPWMRATPPGATVAGGFLRITNRGSEPDRLVSASIPVATGGEIHATSVEGGVARMTPVAGGLEIKPGETVELRPGGFHVMFTGLSRSVAVGEAVEATLTFQRAGTVSVRFAVAPVGAPGLPAGEHQH